MPPTYGTTATQALRKLLGGNLIADIDAGFAALADDVDAKLAELFAAPPQARAFNSANISIPNNAVTALTFDSERHDTGALHSTSSNTGRLTAPSAGLYAIGACVRWNPTGGGTRQLYLRLNGATFIAEQVGDFTSGAAVMQTIETQYRLAATDYVEVVVLQQSGGALNVLAFGNTSPEFWMARLGA